MSDAPFQRPGSAVAPGTDGNGHRTGSARWRRSSPAPGTSGKRGPASSEPILLTAGTDEPQPTDPARLRLVIAALAGVVAGMLMTTSILAPDQASGPRPLTLTPDTFPREVLGHGREDLAYRDIDARPVVERFDRLFSRQLENYRFAHGGDGARLPYTVGAGPGYALTIVNALLTPAVPGEGYAQFYPWDGPVVVTLESGDVICTIELVRSFEVDPEGGFRVVQVTGDVAVFGTTRCILLDVGRNLSLGLEDLAPREAEPGESARRFSEELRALHDHLVG